MNYSNWYMSQEIGRERVQDWIREKENDRKVKLAEQTRIDGVPCRLLCWLGKLMVHIGNSLMQRYGSNTLAAQV